MHSFSDKRRLSKTRLTIIISIFITAITAFSCASFIFPIFKVTHYSYTNDYILISFSDTPDLTSIKNSITFSKDGCSEDYILEKYENSIYLYPINSITQNADYKLTINTEAEDINGNSLLEIFEWNFSTRPSHQRPEVQNIEYNSNSLTLNFNSQINRETFDSSFSISPFVKYFAYWQNNDTSVSVIFQEPLKNNKRYLLSISSELQNLFNNNLLDEYSYTFVNNPSNEITTYTLTSNSQNSEIPLSSTSLNEYISVDSKFYLRFSNKIEISNIASNISIIPPIDFNIQKNTETFSEAVITLQEEPNAETEYTIKISDEIKDYNGRSIKGSEFHLLFNNPAEQKIKFLTALIQKDEEILFLSLSENYQNIYFEASLYPTADIGIVNYIDIIYFFALSPLSSQIDYFSAIENIKISSTLNCLELQPETLEIIPNGNEQNPYFSILNDKYQNFQNTNLCAVKFHCRIQNKESSGLINISINKDLSDNLKNQMDNSVSLTLNKR